MLLHLPIATPADRSITAVRKTSIAPGGVAGDISANPMDII
jgi:hypothetical protein